MVRSFKHLYDVTSAERQTVTTEQLGRDWTMVMESGGPCEPDFTLSRILF